ncbi:MAG TPA: hypothetical protein VI669_08110 [Vicinamibacteria bacterium]
MGFQDAGVAVIVLLAGAFLWRHFRPRRRRTVAFIPLNQVKPRPRPAPRRAP